jgi:hypothetical protein
MARPAIACREPLDSSLKVSISSTPRVSDIDYFYVSRLAGEPLDGIADLHTHPALPRTIRVGVQLSF